MAKGVSFLIPFLLLSQQQQITRKQQTVLYLAVVPSLNVALKRIEKKKREIGRIERKERKNKRKKE